MRNLKVTVWGLIVLVLGAITLWMVSLAQGPDRELVLFREFPSKVPITTVSAQVTDLKRWPEWFHALEEARVISGPSTSPQVGSVIKLSIDTHKTPWSHFELVTRVEEFVPGKKFRLKVLEDSSGKLTTLFDRIEWMVEVEGEGSGSRIRGAATAHTSHWRSRVFGTLAEKILLHQIFYPNLLKLAEFKPRDASSPGLQVGSPPSQNPTH